MAADDPTASLVEERAPPTGPTRASEDRGRAAGPALAAGDVVGRYTVRDRLGGGGMGEVFAAHDPELDRVVAIEALPARGVD